VRIAWDARGHGSSLGPRMISLRAACSALLVTLCSLAAVTLEVSPARADGPRVAVLPFEGSEAISSRLAVHEALGRGGVDVVSLGAAGDAARRARVRGLSRRGISRALEYAEADAALRGRTRVERDEVRVRLVLASGSGEVLLDREVGLDELDDAASAIRTALGRTRPSAGTLATRSARVAAPTMRADREARAGRTDHAQRGEPAPIEEGEAPELPWLALGIGASARLRDAAFDAEDGTRFHRAWYPSIDLGAELRPFHVARGIERGLFVRAAFHHSVGLRTIGPNDTVVDTSFWGLGADAGLLLAIADGWDVGFVIGIGVDSFGLAETSATLVPTALYGTLRPGLRARAQLLDELVVLDVGASYRWLFERGPIGAAFGASGESHGFDASLSLGGSVDVGFSWALSAELTGAFHQHHGEAELVSASGGRDLGVRFGARIGLALR
jgi:hypothetical protein